MLGLLIAGLVLGALGTAASVGLGAAQSESNVQSVKDTNAANLQAVRETNQANVEQSNLAYQRSLPVNQVSNLVNAGMSKPAALNSLSGGGTYSAPVLQTATAQSPQKDYSGIMSAMERLGGIPTAVAQQKLMKEQLHALEVDTYNKQMQEKRAADLHEYEIWNKTYGKDVTQKLDAASSLIMNKLLDSGKDINDFKSYESLVRGLGLQDSKEVRDLPSIARQQLFSSVKDKYAESREQREQENRDTAAEDAHLLSELNREDLQNRINDYKAEKNARVKEYKLRELQAEVNTILAKDGLSLTEYQHSLEFNDDGSVRFSRKVSERAKRAWDRLADTIGVGVLRDLVRGVVTVGKM